MVNLQSVRRQLTQEELAFFSDEGVLNIVMDIVMSEPGVFDDLFPVIGMFHHAKVVMRCGGRLLTGSGMDSACIESGVFGAKILQQVLAATHYVRCLQGLLIISEMLDKLLFEAFWEANQEAELLCIKDIVCDLREALADKCSDRSSQKLDELLNTTDILRQKLDEYVKECSEKSALCQYFMVFQEIVMTLKKIIISDRDGNWPLHVHSIGSSLKIFAEFDAYRYHRITSWYYERIKVLEKTRPQLFRRFNMGYFVVRDREGSKFSAVSGDLKLEQSVNRFTTGPGAPATVGKPGDEAALTEFALLFHEILAITNLLQSLTSPKLLDHNETNIRHDITGSSGLVFDQNVKKLLDFVKARVNPFRMPEARVPLYNIVSNQTVSAAIESRLVNCLKNGETIYLQIRKEMFVDKSRKISDTLHRRMLPTFVTETPKEKVKV